MCSDVTASGGRNEQQVSVDAEAEQVVIPGSMELG